MQKINGKQLLTFTMQFGHSAAKRRRTCAKSSGVILLIAINKAKIYHGGKAQFNMFSNCTYDIFRRIPLKPPLWAADQHLFRS